MKWLTEHNLLCKQNGFKAVTASGPENMEGVMAEYRKTENFIVIDDTSDNRVYSGRPGMVHKVDDNGVGHGRREIQRRR